MSKVGFNKNLKKSCAYCVHGTVLELTNETVCAKRGIIEGDECCRSYKYNPINRIPEKIKLKDNYKPEDFEI